MTGRSKSLSWRIRTSGVPSTQPGFPGARLPFDCFAASVTAQPSQADIPERGPSPIACGLAPDCRSRRRDSVGREGHPRRTARAADDELRMLLHVFAPAELGHRRAKREIELLVPALDRALSRTQLKQ